MTKGKDDTLVPLTHFLSLPGRYSGKKSFLIEVGANYLIRYDGDQVFLHLCFWQLFINYIGVDVTFLKAIKYCEKLVNKSKNAIQNLNEGIKANREIVSVIESIIAEKEEKNKQEI